MKQENETEQDSDNLTTINQAVKTEQEVLEENLNGFICPKCETYFLDNHCFVEHIKECLIIEQLQQQMWKSLFNVMFAPFVAGANPNLLHINISTWETNLISVMNAHHL